MAGCHLRLARPTKRQTLLKISRRPNGHYMSTWQVSKRTEVRIGIPLPMGVHEFGRGVNFAFFSRNASRVRLELFDHS